MPSVIWLELPAVITPSALKAGFNEPSFSIVVSPRMPSSLSMRSVAPSPWRMAIGTISSTNAPLRVAAAAFW